MFPCKYNYSWNHEARATKPVMVFKLIVGATKPFVKQGTVRNHSIKNKHAEAVFPEWWRRRRRQDDEGSVVCTSYFPFVPTAYSITNLFCGF